MKEYVTFVYPFAVQCIQIKSNRVRIEDYSNMLKSKIYASMHLIHSNNSYCILSDDNDYTITY